MACRGKYLPKSANLAALIQRELNAIAARLNTARGRRSIG
jgi:hypothetical protein